MSDARLLANFETGAAHVRDEHCTERHVVEVYEQLEANRPSRSSESGKTMAACLLLSSRDDATLDLGSDRLVCQDFCVAESAPQICAPSYADRRPQTYFSVEF